MRILKTATLALALTASMPALAATDGTPGTTSTGTFNASLQVNAPTGTTVQVTSLEDFIFPAVTGGITTNTPVPPVTQFFCLNRSTPGNVLVTINQTGNAGAFNLNDGAGHTLSLSMLVNSFVSSAGPSNGVQFTTEQGSAGCTAATVATGAGAHELVLSPGTVVSQTAGQAYGNFSGSFTIVVAAQ